MITISYHDTVKELQGLNWHPAGPFARLEWFALLEDAGHKPLIALAKEGEEAVALPLCRVGNKLEILTNWYAFTWSGLRTASAPVSTLLEALASDLARESAQISLGKLAAEDGALAQFTSAFRKAGWQVFKQVCDTNHFLPIGGCSFADYLASRPGQLRSTIKRKAKLVDIALSQRFSPEDWAAYEDIYAESWKPEEGDPALLRAFAEEEATAGRMRFGIASHDRVPVAAQFWTVENGIAYIHKLAHRESAKPLSAGTSLTAALFEQVIDHDKVREVDFGTGDDPYKRDWMEEARARYTLTCLRPEKPANWPLIARLAARKLVRRGGNG